MRIRRAGVSWGVGLLAVCLVVGPAIVAGAPAASATGGLQGNGSVDEAWLTGATPGDSVTLMQGGLPVVNAANPGTADALGSLIIRDVAPGTGYSWDDTTASASTGTFAVLAPGDNPATSSALYSGQTMHEGLNYLTMRDGVQVAATVRFPYSYPAGVTPCTSVAPCPTVIEYSGYNVAGPSDPIPPLVAAALGGPCTGCGDPNLLPSGSTEVGAVLARVSGFATVSLQMRGTGCSGGAFDLFGYPSDYDAYDAIEIVAHQAWVANHKVGMVGISYSGLSQLPSAGTNPPDLAAIAPLSPTDDLFSTGYPGGIFNSGFAASWIGDRINDAMPAAQLVAGQLAQLASTPVAGVGQPWTYYEIDAELAATAGASSTCLANQALHLQSESLQTLVGPQMVAPGTGAGRDPALFDRRSMTVWASHITKPVFVSGAFQDEQTGPQWPALLRALPATNVFANMVNGGHIDSTDPQIISRWLEFLDIYVAQKVPTAPSFLAGIVLDDFAGTASTTSAQAALPAIRFTTSKTLAKAQASFAKKTPRVEVFFDSGANLKVGAGDPAATYSHGYTSWPPKGNVLTYYFGPGASLNTKAPAASTSASLTLDPTVRPSIDLLSGNVWSAAPNWNWTTVPAIDSVAFQTAPFTKATTIVGPASVDLWVTSATPVEDYQVTVTEARPSAAQEEYVTSGFLRSSNQVSLADSTSLFTDPSYVAANAHNLSPSSYELVKIPVDPIAHTFRSGTELRIVISAPGGDRPAWEFATVDTPATQATVGMGGAVASSLVVNKVGAGKVPAALPGCGILHTGILRGEPCRALQAGNNGAAVRTVAPVHHARARGH